MANYLRVGEKKRNFAAGFRNRWRDEEVRVYVADKCKTIYIKNLQWT